MTAARVTADVKYGNNADYDQLSQWQRDASPWTVTLKYRGRKMSVNFWTGSALTNDPTAADVLECVIRDIPSSGDSFEDFCADFGYDTDSRSAERTYNAVKEQTVKLRRLLGDDFDDWAQSDSDAWNVNDDGAPAL